MKQLISFILLLMLQRVPTSSLLLYIYTAFRYLDVNSSFNSYLILFCCVSLSQSGFYADAIELISRHPYAWSDNYHSVHTYTNKQILFYQSLRSIRIHWN